MTDDMEAQRQHLIASLRNSGVTDERVLAAFLAIPREEFIPAEYRHLAYENCALPLDMGQTISQPLMVAIMTQALLLKGSERVLEIGTGSGYQAAILAKLAAYIYSIERIEQLALWAALHLSQLGLENVSIFVGDGTKGWPAEAPYDRIIVTAAAPELPRRLVEQLVTWGIMVIPVGSHEHQDLLVVHRAPWGPEIRSLGGCVFVPLIGEEGWHE